MYEIEQNDRRNDVFQYYNNLKQWEENENCTNQDELKNIDQFNYTSIKKNINIRQPPVCRQGKVSRYYSNINFLFIYILIIYFR